MIVTGTYRKDNAVNPSPLALIHLPAPFQGPSNQTIERGYCFNHQGRTKFVVETHPDGQETTICGGCAAVGHGKAAR